MELGRIVAMNPREVWVHEATQFTPWLLDNADRLSEALGIDIELTAAEHPVGNYLLDLIGTDVTNDVTLIVENQLETTDHSHLGQLLTYAAGAGASTIVWIATDFREEHRQALDWLNENTAEETRFFGVKLKLVRIGSSEPAPLFDLLAAPNDWQKQVRAAARSERRDGKGVLYVDFWTRYLDRVHEDHPNWTRSRKAPAQNWCSSAAPIRGASFNAVFSGNQRIRYELYIDTGDGDTNLDRYHKLLEQRSVIETAYGRPLDWEELPNRRAKRVTEYGPAGDVAETERFKEYIDWFVDAGERFRHAISAAGYS